MGDISTKEMMDQFTKSLISTATMQMWIVSETQFPPSSKEFEEEKRLLDAFVDFIVECNIDTSALLFNKNANNYEIKLDKLITEEYRERYEIIGHYVNEGLYAFQTNRYYSIPKGLKVKTDRIIKRIEEELQEKYPEGADSIKTFINSLQKK